MGFFPKILKILGLILLTGLYVQHVVIETMFTSFRLVRFRGVGDFLSSILAI